MINLLGTHFKIEKFIGYSKQKLYIGNQKLSFIHNHILFKFVILSKVAMKLHKIVLIECFCISITPL